MPIGPRTKILDKIKKTAPKDGLFKFSKAIKKIMLLNAYGVNRCASAIKKVPEWGPFLQHSACRLLEFDHASRAVASSVLDVCFVSREINAFLNLHLFRNGEDSVASSFASTARNAFVGRFVEPNLSNCHFYTSFGLVILLYALNITKCIENAQCFSKFSATKQWQAEPKPSPPA